MVIRISILEKRELREREQKRALRETEKQGWELTTKSELDTLFILTEHELRKKYRRRMKYTLVYGSINDQKIVDRSNLARLVPTFLGIFELEPDTDTINEILGWKDTGCFLSYEEAQSVIERMKKYIEAELN